MLAQGFQSIIHYVKEGTAGFMEVGCADMLECQEEEKAWARRRLGYNI